MIGEFQTGRWDDDGLSTLHTTAYKEKVVIMNMMHLFAGPAWNEFPQVKSALNPAGVDDGNLLWPQFVMCKSCHAT